MKEREGKGGPAPCPSTFIPPSPSHTCTHSYTLDSGKDGIEVTPTTLDEPSTRTGGDGSRGRERMGGG